MKVLVITSGKGGSGKTTLTVNLAAALAAVAGPVLVIDADPQASASRWLGADGAGSPLTALFEGDDDAPPVDLAAAAVSTTAADVELVTASPALGKAARNAPPDTVTAMRGAVRRLPQDRWRYVLIDTPPALDLLTLSAMMAADHAVVAADASAITLDALAPTLAAIARVGERGDGLALAGLLLGRVDTRQNFARDLIATVRQRRGPDVFAVTLRESVRFREAAALRQPITRAFPASGAAADVRAAADELQERLR